MKLTTAPDEQQHVSKQLVEREAAVFDGKKRPAKWSLREAVYYSGTLDSEVRARKVLMALTWPVRPSRFYSEYFQKESLLLRGKADAFDWLCTADDVWHLLEHNELVFGVDLDLTKYCDAQRRNVASGDYDAAAVREHFDRGATVRLRSPQERIEAIHALCESLEDEFGATTSANVYMTPASSCGFAPHYDDVDVFVLQVAGRKRWHVYEPLTEAAKLPRQSSADFRDVDDVLSVGDYGNRLEETLEPGDVLYLPRGFVHHAKTLHDHTSLHVTLSTHRQNTWADFLERLLDHSMTKLAAAEYTARQALPRDYLHVFGLQHAGNFESLPANQDDVQDDITRVTAARLDPELDRGRQNGAALRAKFKETATVFLNKLVETALNSLDDAADDMATRFVAERQPPHLTSSGATSLPPISSTTALYPAGRRQARLLVQGEKAILYHSRLNSPAHRKNPVALLEFDLDDAPAIEILLNAHSARPVVVNQLPLPTVDDQLALAAALYQEGLLARAQST